MKQVKKNFFPFFIAITILCAVAYGAGKLINTPEMVLTGDVVNEKGAPQRSVQIGGEAIQYRETRKNNLSKTHNFQNSEVVNTEFIYLNQKKDIFTFDRSGELVSFIRSEQIRGEESMVPKKNISEVEAAIEHLKGLEIEVSEEQLESSHEAEGGTYSVVFQMGKDPRIEDHIIVALDADLSLYSAVVQKSGIDSMDEVDTEYFDQLFSEYCANLEKVPEEVDIRYKRIDGNITARYYLHFSDAEEGFWMDMVSFV